jgi:S1-C subfamily serine protease
MKLISKVLILILVSSCAGVPVEQTEETTTTLYIDPLLVTTTENLPDAVVRIVVSSTQAELTEELEIEIFEFEGTGSGFFINSNGYIVTNNHVVAGAVTIKAYTSYRTKPYTAKLIGQSECDDIAILKIDIEDNKYLDFSNEGPKLGQEILAVGFPRGDEEVTFLDGIVSKKESNGSTSWASIDYAFEHTAEILPGSSGGPVVDADVKVIGIAYAGNEDRQEFGIPIIVVEEKINQIISGEFKYTFKANVEQFYDVGLYIYSVDSNSPLKKVGLQGGEIITEIKGLSIIEENTLEIYCDALLARNPDIGIKFKGISLNTFEEFEFEVSLDGVIADNTITESGIASPQPTEITTTTVNETTTTVAKAEVKNEITDPPIVSYQISQETVSIDDYPVVTYQFSSYIDTRISNLAGFGFMYNTIGATSDSDKRIFSLIDTNLDGKTDYICAPQVIDYDNDPYCRDYFGTEDGGWTMKDKGNDGWGYEYELLGVYSIYETNDDEHYKVTGFRISNDYFKDVPGFDDSIESIYVDYCLKTYLPSFAYGINRRNINISQTPGGKSFALPYCGYEDFGRLWKSGEYFFILKSTKSNDLGEDKSLSSFVGSGNEILPFDNYSKRLFSK